jgi:hypothetical protein
MGGPLNARPGPKPWQNKRERRTAVKIIVKDATEMAHLVAELAKNDVVGKAEWSYCEDAWVIEITGY